MTPIISVSILMPIYKVEQYLEKALFSVFTQTYHYIDYVFVDDCSPDKSMSVLNDMIRKFGIEDSRYTIINHEQNLGIAVSRTECISKAKGDYIFFVDSDDWIEKDTVEQMVLATRNGSIDIVGCDYIDEYSEGRSSYHYENYADTCSENLVRCLNYEVSPVLWKMLIKKSLFDCFFITPNLNIGEDYAISIKLYYYGKSFAALHKAFYHYVHYNLQKLSYQRSRSLQDHIRIVREVEEFLKEKHIYGEEVSYRLKLRKFNIKSNFLIKRTLNYQAYRDVFPEVNNMWRSMNYSQTEKMKYWLAEKNLYCLLYLLQRVFR